MGVILTVLVSIAAFFIYIVRKEAATLKNAAPQPQPEI
jgi:hypothetical protein